LIEVPFVAAVRYDTTSQINESVAQLDPVSDKIVPFSMSTPPIHHRKYSHGKQQNAHEVETTTSKIHPRLMAQSSSLILIDKEIVLGGQVNFQDVKMNRPSTLDSISIS